MHPGSVLTNSSFRAKIVPLHLYHWHIVPLKLILLYQYIIQAIRGWWRRGGSNPLPQRCQRCALPDELRPHVQ